VPAQDTDTIHETVAHPQLDGEPDAWRAHESGSGSPPQVRRNSFAKEKRRARQPFDSSTAHGAGHVTTSSLSTGLESNTSDGTSSLAADSAAAQDCPAAVSDAPCYDPGQLQSRDICSGPYGLHRALSPPLAELVPQTFRSNSTNPGKQSMFLTLGGLARRAAKLAEEMQRLDPDLQIIGYDGKVTERPPH